MADEVSIAPRSRRREKKEIVEDDEESHYVKKEPSNPLMIWIWVLVGIVIVLLLVVAYYVLKYDPHQYGHHFSPQTRPPQHQPPPQHQHPPQHPPQQHPPKSQEGHVDLNKAAEESKKRLAPKEVAMEVKVDPISDKNKTETDVATEELREVMEKIDNLKSK